MVYTRYRLIEIASVLTCCDLDVDICDKPYVTNFISQLNHLPAFVSDNVLRVTVYAVHRIIMLKRRVSRRLLRAVLVHCKYITVAYPTVTLSSSDGQMTNTTVSNVTPPTGNAANTTTTSFNKDLSPKIGKIS